MRDGGLRRLTISPVGHGPQQRRVQSRQVNRFDEELFGSFLDGTNRQFRRILAGQNYDGNIGVHVPDPLQKLKSITIGEGKVEDGRVRTEPLKL